MPKQPKYPSKRFMSYKRAAMLSDDGYTKEQWSSVHKTAMIYLELLMLRIELEQTSKEAFLKKVRSEKK